MTVLRTIEIAEGESYEGFTLEIVDMKESSVTFIDGPRDPVGTIARVVMGYSGNYNPDFVPNDLQIKDALKNLNKTKLKTPLEMGTVVFLVNDVPRSFTHQMVRTRIGASFVQESMRFAGHKSVYRVMISTELSESEVGDEYCDGITHSLICYEKALTLKIPIEDARAILPTDVLTSLFVGYQLSTFAKVYEQRLCCQAQRGIWQIIVKKMKDQLVNIYGSEFSTLISAPFERGEDCGYHSSADRPCIWQKAK